PDPDDREHDPEPVHRGQRLPGGERAVGHPDADDRCHGPVLREASRDGGPAVIRWLQSKIVLILGILVLVYTFVPISVVVVMSFNKLPSEQSKIYKFNQFTLDNWLHPCADPSMCHALGRSIEIGLLATLGATILGTLAAFALVRHSFVGRSSTNVLIFLPMAAPEIVMGSSLLALFVSAGFAGQLGFVTILIAHIMFCLSFLVVTVLSRVAGLSATLQHAALA